MPRRFVLILMAGFGVAAGGCFLPWAVPSASRCPPADVRADGPDEVVAVYVRAVTTLSGTAPIPSETHTLQRADVVEGTVPAQVRMYLARGYLMHLGLIAGGTSTREYVLTKLYRPGFKTVVIEPGADRTAARWEPAASPGDREQAVHDLLYRVRSHQYVREYEPTLAPGSADARHREVLLFAAGEYDAVAALYPDGSADRERCRQEAARLRTRAGE